MIWRLLNYVIANDLDQSSRLFQLFLSENICILLFQSLIECPGDVEKDDIANDLESPLITILGTVNGFVICISKIQYT